MTRITNLPPLTTLTNQLLFPVADISQSPDRTRTITVSQLITLIGSGGDILESANTATNIAGGAASLIPVQTRTGRTGFDTRFRYTTSTGALSAPSFELGEQLTGDTIRITGGASGEILATVNNSDGDLSISTLQDTAEMYLGNRVDNSVKGIVIYPVSGNVLINSTQAATSPSTGALVVNGGVGINGNMYVTGSTFSNTPSDRRLKENITTIENPLELLSKITGTRFDWIDSYIESLGGEDGNFVKKRDMGVIAQDVEQVLPEIVGTKQDGFKTVKYEKLIPLLIESIKALSVEVTDLKEQLARLQ
jgi:hypothetical protein